MSKIEDIVNTFSKSYAFCMIPMVCMLPSLLSNLNIIRSTLESEVLSRHLRKIYPISSQLTLITTCIAAIVSNNRSNQRLNGAENTYIPTDVVFCIQAVGGFFLLSVLISAYFILKTQEGRKQGAWPLVYACGSFVVKTMIYSKVYGLILLDVIIISIYENIKYKKRVVLFGSFVFSIFCEVTFTFFVLTEMEILKASQVLKTWVFCIGVLRFFYNIFAYFYLRYTVLKRLTPGAVQRRRRRNLPDHTLDDPLTFNTRSLRL